jgi:hypothetical protein
VGHDLRISSKSEDEEEKMKKMKKMKKRKKMKKTPLHCAHSTQVCTQVLE